MALYFQWGFYSFGNASGLLLKNQPFIATWPKSFPNVCETAWANFATNAVFGPGALNQAALSLEVVGPPFQQSYLEVFSDWNDSGTITVGASGMSGFTYFGIGF
jgi:hypothetical protein